MRKNQGITLIALVITIIVLLILAGVSIATLTGQNGLLTKASTAGEETKKAEYKEVLELIGNGLRPEKVLEQLSAEEFINRYQEAIEEEIKEGTTLEGATVEKKNETTLWVTTKEGYVYEITEDKVELLGQKGKNPPPDLQETDIEFKLTPSGYTTQNVVVEIIPKIEIEGYTLQYSTDGETWTNYIEKVTFKENGTIHARLVNALDEVGGVATKTIDMIDREKPNQATITLSKTSVSIGDQLTATVTQSDAGSSGLAIANCKYIFTTSSTEIGVNPSSYTGGKFTSETQTLTLNTNQMGTYYLHVLSVDKAGNKRETISKAVTIRDTTLPNDAIITFSKTAAMVGDTITATVTQSDGQSGVDIANCKYIFTTSNTALGTSNVSKYTGGGFTKTTNDKITLNCTASGSYYLHVLTVDKAGNKKETISSELKVEAFVKWLIKDGQIIDSNYTFVNWGTSGFTSSTGHQSHNSSMSNNGRFGVYWSVSGVGAATKVVYEGAGGSSNRTHYHYLYYSNTHNTGTSSPASHAFGSLLVNPGYKSYRKVNLYNANYYQQC